MIKTFRKLNQLFNEVLPGRRIYYIYTHKNGFNRFYNGLKSNTELSYWGFTALKKAFPRVSFLRFDKEKPSRIEKIQPCDVVIGHAGETFIKACERTKRAITFGPWVGHEDHSENQGFNCAPKEYEFSIYEKAAGMILLTSEYNVREYLERPRNFWHPFFQKMKAQSKRVRVVHQPIDLHLFNRIKWDYATSDFLYIGNNGHMKCVDASQSLVESVGRKLIMYGFDGKKIDHLDQSQVSTLPSQADFFIQPGMWEAQCVSILEAAARGFIPVVSPETGYPYSHPFLLRYGDFSYNRSVLEKLLKTTPDERKSLAGSLHKQLIEDSNHNSWEALTSVLVEEVKHLYNAS